MRTTSATGSKGFTLVEIIIALTVISVLVAASVPGVQGVIREHEARQPLRELQELAQVARDRAVRTGRPCQIGFDQTGFYASDYLQPYVTNGDYERLLEESRVQEAETRLREASEGRFGAPEKDEGGGDDEVFFLERREWPPEVRVKVRTWGSQEWTEVSGGQFQRWVFEGNGLCLPLLVRVEQGSTAMVARFNALTGDIEEELVDAL